MSDLKRSKSFAFLVWLVVFFVGFYSFFPSSVFGSIEDIINGAQIESGDVTFDRPDANTLIVNASDRSIINFNSFSIGEQESVRFVQPMDSSSVLGRVLGGSESRLLGTLFSNGEFILVNPNGIFVGANANINVGSLIMSTLNISSEMYRSGQYVFQKPDGFDPAKIFNEGTIRAAEGGHVALLADSIENRGTIEARMGTVALGVGKKQTLTFDSLGLMNLVVDEAVARELLGSEEAIKNAGGIVADGGKVILTAKLLNDTFDHLINNEGVIQATHAEERDGKIVFVSNAGIDNSGTLDTNVLDEKGGTFRSTGTVTGGDAFYDNLDGAANISGNIGSNQTDVGDLIVTGNITLTADNLIFTADSDNNGVGMFDMNSGTQISDGASSYTLTLKTGQNSNLRTIDVETLILDRAGNASTPVYTLNNALGITNLTVQASTTLYLNAQMVGLSTFSNEGTIRLIGTETVSITTIDSDSGTFEYVGDGAGGTTTFTVRDFGGSDYYNLRINGESGDVFSLGNTLQLGGGLIINSGILSLAGNNLSTEQITNNDTLRLRGSETVTSTMGNDLDSGTWEYVGDGDSASDTFTLIDWGVGVTDYYNLVINATDSNEIFQTTDAKEIAGVFTLTRGSLEIGNGFEVTGDTTVNGGSLSALDSIQPVFGNLSISSGTFGLFSGVDINGNFNQSGGTFNASNNDTTISGNFTHSAGTFNHNNGTITLDGTNQSISGSTTFYNLTKIDGSNNGTDLTLTFDNTGTQTIEGTLTLTGIDANDRINLVSDSPGTRWELNCSTCTLSVTWVESTDSDASSGDLITHSNTISGGNNLNWGFGITTTWTGASSSVWSLAGNWNNGTPGSEDTAIIADVTTDPILDTSVSITALTISVGGLLTLAGNNLTVSGTFSNSGTVALRGTETISLTQDIDSGTWRYVGISDAMPNTYTIKDFGSTDYYNLEISTLDSDSFEIGAANVVAGALTVTAGTYRANGNTTTVAGLTTVSSGTYLSSTAIQTFNGGLTISGGTYTGAGGDVDVNGNLTLSSGSLTAPSGTFTVSGNWTGGGTFTAGTGTVTFDGSGAQSLSESSNFYNLTHSGSGTMTVTSGSIAMSNRLTISGGVFDLDGHDITFYGGGSNFSNDATLQLRGSETITNISQDTDSGTWRYKGDGDSAADTIAVKDFGATDYYNLVINSTDSNDTYQSGAAKTIAGAFTVTAGTYDINGNTTTTAGLATVNGGTYNANGGSQTFNGGFTISSGSFTAAAEGVDVNGNFSQSGGTFTAAGPAGSFTVSGNFSNSGGSFVHNSGTITFDGSANQTFTTGGVTFNNVTLNNSGSSGSDRLIVSGNLDVNGNLTVTAGDLRLSTNNPNVNTAGNVTVSASAFVTKGSGTWTFDGSGTSTLSANSQDFGNVTVDGSSKTLQLTTTAATFDTMTIGADDILDLNGVNVTISTLANNNILQLRGSENITLSANDLDSGTWRYIGDGDTNADTFMIKNFGATDYFNLVINSTDSNDAYQLISANDLAGALTVTAGTYNANLNTTTVAGLTTVNGGTYATTSATQTFNGGLTVSSGTFTGAAGTIDVNGDFIHSGGALTLSSGNTQVSGDFNNSGGTLTHNSGTLIFDNASNSQTFTTNGSTFNNVTMNLGGTPASDRLTISGNLDVDGNLALTDGELRLSTNNPNVNVAGNVTVGASASIAKGSGTWTFDGSGTSTLAGNSQDFGNVTVNGTTKTLQLVTSASTFDTLTIGADDIFDLNGINTTITTLANNNMVQLRGSETITLTSNDTDSGTWKYVGDNDGSADTYSIKDFGGTDYYNLLIDSVDAENFQLVSGLTTAGTFTQNAGVFNANGQAATYNGLMTLSGGTYQSSTSTQTFNAGMTFSSGTFTGSSGLVDINGNFAHSGGTFTAPSGSLNVSGDFNRTGGTFSANGGTVNLDGSNQTITGSTTFNNLAKTVSSAATLTFTQGTTQTVAGTLTLQGASGNLLSLRSSSNGTAWNLTPQSTVNAEYVNVRDSNNTGATIYATNGINSTGNTGWDFGAGGGGGGGNEETSDEDSVDNEEVTKEINRTPIITEKDPVKERKFEDPKKEEETKNDNKPGTDRKIDPKTGPNTEKNDPKGGPETPNTGNNNAPKEKKVVTYVFVEEGAVNVENGGNGTMVYPGENIKYSADGKKSLQTRGVYVVTGDQVKGLRRTKYNHEVMKGDFRWSENPSALAASHDGSTVFVVLPKSGKVATIDTQNQELGRDIRGLDDGANNILMSPDDKRAFVSDNVKDEIMVMNVKEQKVERTIQTRSRPAGIQVSSDGNTLFVANEWDGSISQINANTGEETGLIPAGKAPYALALSKDEKQLYATDRAQGKVMIFERGEDGKFKMQKEIQVGEAPTDIAVAPQDGILFVTNRNSKTVAVVDSREGKVLQNMAVGERPTAITIVPEGNYAYVANELSGTISHIDLASKRVIEDIPAGTAPRRVVISTPPQRALHPKGV